jgi:hypothetical protein
LYKLCQIRRGRHAIAYHALIVALGFQCLTFTMGVVTVASPVLLGVRNLGILAVHMSAVALCISARIVLLLWAAPPAKAKAEIRYWTATGIALGAALAALFFAGGAPGLPQAALETGSSDPFIFTYLLLFVVSQAAPCVLIYRQCLSYAKIAPDPWLRRALRLLAVSAVVLFLYCVARAVNILSALFGISIGTGEWQIIAAIASAVGILILSLGLTMPSWGTHLSSLHRWFHDYRSYRALYPLWHSMYESSPGIALEPPTASVTNMQYRLHRRVIEIRDAWRMLRPYMSELDAEAQAGADGSAGDEAKHAAIEAMRIMHAIQAKESGCPAADSRLANDAGVHDLPTFSAEVSWLTRVSEAYARL